MNILKHNKGIYVIRIGIPVEYNTETDISEEKTQKDLEDIKGQNPEITEMIEAIEKGGWTVEKESVRNI